MVNTSSCLLHRKVKSGNCHKTSSFEMRLDLVGMDFFEHLKWYLSSVVYDNSKWKTFISILLQIKMVPIFQSKSNYFQLLRACWFSCASLEKWQVFFNKSIFSWSTIHYLYWLKSEIKHEMISNSAIMDFLLSSLRIDISSEKSQTRRIWSVVLTDNLGHNWDTIGDD